MSYDQLQSQQDTIRVPAYGTEGFRNDWALFDQQLINCYAEVVRNPVTGEGEVVVSKRRGMTRSGSADMATHCATLGTGAHPMGFLAIPDLYDVYVMAMYDSNFIRVICYRPQAATSVLMGSIPVGNASDKVYLSSGWTGSVAAPVHTFMITWESGVGTSSQAYYADATTGTFAAASLTQITAAQSPWARGKITRGPIVQLNNQFYVATVDGVIYGTGTVTGIASLQSAYVDRTDLTAGAEKGWVTPLAAVSSLVPEQFHCLMRYKHHIVAFGKNTIQFFSDVGNAVGTEGIAIAVTEQAFIKFGCLDGMHVINIDDILYWVAMGADNTVGVWRLDGYSPVKISTKKQDDEIRVSRKAAAHQYNIFSYVNGSKRHLGITGMEVKGLAYFGEEALGGGSTTAGAFIEGESAANVGMYNIEDKTWWYMSFGGYDTTSQINIFTITLVGNQYPPTNNPKNYEQRFLQYDSGGLGNTYIYIPSETVYTDSDRTAARLDIAFVMTCNFNTFSFSVDKRKRINRATIIMANNYGYGSPNWTDTGTLALCYTPNNVADAQHNGGSYPVDRLQKRTMEIPNSYYRYYFNNLGTFRTISMSFLEKSKRPVSLKAIEFNLAQGTH